MRNYMRSEWYRIAHTKELWLFTGACAALLALLNLACFLLLKNTPDFPYGSVHYSLSILTGTMLVLGMAGTALNAILFSGEKKNGILKNAVSYGISRTGIFLGKCVVGSLAAFGSMVVIVAVYAGSAVLLLEGPVEPYLSTMLWGIAANLPFAVACVILYFAFQQVFEKEISALLAWMGVIYWIPQICFYLGIPLQVIGRVAAWMPRNYLALEAQANMSNGYQCLWMEPAGMAKCLIAGFVGIAVFTAAGIWLNRRREL